MARKIDRATPLNSDPWHLYDDVFDTEWSAWNDLLVEEMEAADQPSWLNVASKNELEALGHDSDIRY